MAVYKRYGTYNEVKMDVEMTMTKEWFCDLLEIDEKAFLMILDSEGNTLATMLADDTEFLPPGPGNYIVKTADDMWTYDDDNVNNLETMWKSMKLTSESFDQLRGDPSTSDSKMMPTVNRRFPLQIGRLNSYVAAEIMKKMSVRAFTRMASTCRWFRDIAETNTFQIDSGAFLHIELMQGDFLTFISYHLFHQAVVNRIAEIPKKLFPLSDLHLYRSFKLRALKINQPNQVNSGEMQVVEIRKTAEIVAKAKIQFGTLHLENCKIEEILEAFMAFKPKRTVFWMKSLDVWELEERRRMMEIFGRRRLQEDGRVGRIHEVLESNLPQEMMIVSVNFEYLSRDFGNTGCRLFDFIGKVSVFQAAALEDNLFSFVDYLPRKFLEMFVNGVSMGKNKISMFIYKRTGKQFILNDFISLDCQIEINKNFTLGRSYDNPRNGHITRFSDGKRLFVESREYPTFETVVFAVDEEKKEDLDEELRKKILYLHCDLDAYFRPYRRI